MTPRQSPEQIVNLLSTYIQNNIKEALNTLSAQGGYSSDITFKAPVKYYVSEDYNANELPAIYVLVNHGDYQLDLKGANHVNAKWFINVSCMMEDQTAKNLTLASYRYEAALHMVLNQVTILSNNQLLRLVVNVNSCEFSDLLTRDQAKNLFRKVVTLKCEVLAYEQY